MDNRIKATRTAIARNRMQVATRALAERYGLAAQVAAIDAAARVPASAREVYQLEATADLLDAIIAAVNVPAANATPASELAVLDAVSPGLAKKLVAAGYDNLVSVREATDDDLVAIKGIAKKTVQKIRAEIGYAEREPDEPNEPLDDAEGMEAEPE